MTGCEVIAYKNGKIYLTKFRHDGYNIPGEYIARGNLDLSKDPKQELIKMMHWWVPGCYDLKENRMRFSWIKKLKWDRKSVTPDEFFSKTTSIFDAEMCNKDDNTVGYGYWCSYSDYRILIDFDKKVVFSFSHDEIADRIIQKGKKLFLKPLNEEPVVNKIYDWDDVYCANGESVHIWRKIRFSLGEWVQYQATRKNKVSGNPKWVYITSIVGDDRYRTNIGKIISCRDVMGCNPLFSTRDKDPNIKEVIE